MEPGTVPGVVRVPEHVVPTRGASGLSRLHPVNSVHGVLPEAGTKDRTP
jgi:hypothetical protein